MIRTKREENSIVIYFGFYAVFFIGLLLCIIVWIYPEMKKIESTKTTVNTYYESIKTLKKEGLNYSDFMGMTQNITLNSYTKELLKNIEEGFYKGNITNKTENTFSDFLKNKNIELKNNALQDIFKEKEAKIVKILPIYTEVEIDLEDEDEDEDEDEGVTKEKNTILTDFKFINYIESILETFSLEYEDDIGLTDVMLVEDYSDTESKSTLETNIYYIPLTLNITGSKYNIIDFLYFLENVGSIDITKEGNLEVYNQNKDGFLSRGGVKTILENKSYLLKGINSNEFSEYNIYENQLIDIESIIFSDYFDSKEKITQIENNTLLSKRLKSTQPNEELSIELKLRFYVKGVQNIKMIDSIQSYIIYFNTTQLIIAQQYSSKKLDSSLKNKVKNYQSLMTELSKDLIKITASVNTQENLTETLVSTSKLTTNLHKIHSDIGYNFYITYFLQELQLLSNDTELVNTNPSLYEYIISIEPGLSILRKGEIEPFDEYNIRINKKEFFQEVYQYQKNINTKK